MHQGQCGDLLRGTWRGKDVVVKRFRVRADQPPVDEVMLRQELDAMGRLRHPSLVTVYGITGRYKK